MSKYKIELKTEFEPPVNPFYWAPEAIKFSQEYLIPGSSLLVEHANGDSLKITNLGRVEQ